MAYTYLLYPAVLFVASSAARRSGRFRHRVGTAARRDALPAVSLIIPAYNEERAPARPSSPTLAELDYPRDRLEVLFVSDGSTDGTNEILGQRGRTPATSRSWPCPRAAASPAP